ncbi:hypothetical protein COCSUDRAFT_56426 [Coccomyxa subellipsoidea C-169]|uniref:Uncharacterized protein n=1 Tax=Coccomyxa subellipsoidea (strain C-169) TaxID=574566 RepID=I0YUB4_COCSC|nr:hypothetical protein COCSUDRAFT_56426 [Coccomyxa subellipsoidea C-169]EIE21983.1 hypothetical protein COCSUDRAFT_56426 [Coccomyxa subellipsoidea C-169]|eukprot:XP_005646527.1 hypothetical protein COCSUDRAFT_56426 [Coccomyxa subellipsoidea C-169]
MAALAMQRAVEQDGDEPQWLQDRDRLLLLVADRPATVLQEEGSAGLERWLAADKERSLPEYQRKRPKYYYYYEWMRQRIADHCGALPESVVDKLLNVEAGELDTLLTYPAGVQAKARSHATFTAKQLLDIFDEHGAEYLETWRLPPLTWTELQELKAQAGVPAIEGSSPDDARMIMGCEQCQPAALEPAVTGNMSDEDAMCEGDEEDLDAVD